MPDTFSIMLPSDITTAKFGQINDVRAQQLRLNDRNWQDWNDQRSAYEAADAAARAGQDGGASPALGAIPQAERAPELTPTPVGGLTFGSNVPAADPRVSSRSPLSYGSAAAAPGPVRAEAVPAAQQAAPAPDTQIGPATDTPALGALPEQGDDPLFAPAPNGQVYTARPPRNAEERAQVQQAAKEKRLAVTPERQAQQDQIDRQHIGPDTTHSIEDWRRMSRGERRAADLPVSEIGAQMYFDCASV